MIVPAIKQRKRKCPMKKMGSPFIIGKKDAMNYYLSLKANVQICHVPETSSTDKPQSRSAHVNSVCRCH